MNTLERLLRQEALATRQLLLRCRNLARDQLDTPLEQGSDSLHKTLIHLVQTVEMWTDLLQQQPVRLYPEPGELTESIEGLITRMDAIAVDPGNEGVEERPAPNGSQSGENEELPLAGAIALVINRNRQCRIVIHQLLSSFTNAYKLEGYLLSQA